MKRILLIEDEEGLRAMVRISLQRMGYAVTEARDGKEAIDLFKNEQVDLVLTDLMMPGKEGLETIRELRKVRPDLKIIAMSGGGRTGSMDSLKMAKALGAAAVISKPFSFDDLGKAVSGLLSEAPPGSPKPET
jgi:DNA-binding response OmpR family regulator